LLPSAAYWCHRLPCLLPSSSLCGFHRYTGALKRITDFSWKKAIWKIFLLILHLYWLLPYCSSF